MKRISIVGALASALLVAACNRTPQTVQVTTQTLASQPAGTAYVIDLTRIGTLYNIAAGLNHSVVRVRTSTGEIPLSDLARGLGTTGPVLVGMFDDLRSKNFGFPSGTSTPPESDPVAAQCDEASCFCEGYRDCNDLDRSGRCRKDGWGCSQGTCVCITKKI